MSCCTQVLREELQWRRIGFDGVKAERFCLSQWRIPAVIYLLYRFVLMAYVIFWLGYTSHFHSNPPQVWEAYLTNWTYTLLAVFLTCHFLAAIVFHVQVRLRPGPPSPLRSCFGRPNPEVHRRLFVESESNVQENSEYEYGSDAESENSSLLQGRVVCRPPWYMCVVWVLFSAVSSGGVMVTMVFFTFLYPSLKGADGIGLENLQVHLLNSVIIVLEHIVTGVPFRLLHVIYPFLYGLTYMIFSVIYWAVDHDHVMYPILDWNKPGPTTGYVLMIGFVIIPVFHTCFFLIYKAKLALYRCL
ncbi:hypothetical protein BaRGS_00025937 [Batillaria attramentaria]|uniref:Protein rolling stone-like n=1 Tax=Batillaria attramentaria TaxID=370345 RepID=A0ABD0K728_9CAEN